MNLSIKASLTAAGLLLAVSANAAPLWVGTATYGNAYTGADTVSGFNAYDFGPGAVLLAGGAAPAVNSTITGYFQSYTASHLATNGATVAAPNLNTAGASGTGAGYELTIAGQFNEHIDGINNGVTSFTLTGGNANLYIGAPDYSFSGDSGFSNGSSILSGTIVGGSGTFSSTGLGVTQLLVQVTSYDGSVFSSAIAGGTSVFTLQAPGSGGSTSFLSGVGSVGGNAVASGDLLLAGDGNLSLTAVPLPPALWLFGSGLAGLVGLTKKRRA